MKAQYDEISPITRNKCVLVEYVTNNIIQKMCMESGYHTQTNFRDDFEGINEIESSMPDFVVEKRVVDDLGFNWYLCHISTNKASLMPQMVKDIVVWAVRPVVLEEGSYKLDFENTQLFDEGEFEQAFDKFFQIEDKED